MKQNRFKENLRKFRENANLTQKAFAEQLGINVTTYRNYENSSREPDYDTLLLICKKLNISLDCLLGVTELKQNNNPHILSTELMKLIDLYNALDIRNQAALVERAETLLELREEDSKFQNSILKPKKGA